MSFVAQTIHKGIKRFEEAQNTIAYHDSTPSTAIIRRTCPFLTTTLIFSLNLNVLFSQLYIKSTLKILHYETTRLFID